ncbi:MAG: hypothetical protein ACI9GH_000092 [Candidatus Paceibacteria bacterium]|jgi:hypothetical protein
MKDIKFMVLTHFNKDDIFLYGVAIKPQQNPLIEIMSQSSHTARKKYRRKGRNFDNGTNVTSLVTPKDNVVPASSKSKEDEKDKTSE